jgi:hypothetical protein
VDPTGRLVRTPELTLPPDALPSAAKPGDERAHVEVRACGEQIVAFGIHPDTGAPYTWTGETPLAVPLADLPTVTADDLRAYLVECERIIRAAGGVGTRQGVQAGAADTAGTRGLDDIAPPSVAAVVALLDALPNPVENDRQVYQEVMLAAAGCAQAMADDPGVEDIGAAAVRWADRWPDPEGRNTDEAAKWESDWSQRERPLAGWATLKRHAIRAIPGWGAEAAAAEFSAPPTGGFGSALVHDLPAIADLGTADDWKSMLRRGKPKADGTPGGLLPDLANASLALRVAPPFVGAFQHDAFALRDTIRVAPPWHAAGVPWAPRPVADLDHLEAAVWLQCEGLAVSKLTAADAVHVAASKDTVHPVRAYLDGLQHDGAPRAAGWLVEHCGAADTPFNRAIAEAFLISMVARIYRPGCKVDSVLILEGPQGLLKSTALAVLGGPWFVDHMPDLASKDAAIQLCGKWLVEFAELDKLGRADANRAKSFISTATDTFRPPYGRVAADFPRQCVFAGTVNPGAVGYLPDETGNRRFWPVACGVGWPETRKINVTALAAERDQLFAEAVALYRAGRPWWLATAELDAAQREGAAARFSADAWGDRIAAYLADREDVSIGEVLQECLGKPAGQWTIGDQMRAGRVLTAAGWIRWRASLADGSRAWRYRRAAAAAVVAFARPATLAALVS